MKCSPAVGAATAPGRAAYTVWYRSSSSSPAARWMYGGRGMAPQRCSRSSTGTRSDPAPPSASRVTAQVPSAADRSSIRATTPAPHRRRSPALSFFAGRAMARHPPSSSKPAAGSRKRSSTCPPVSR